jgi:hypothetical protein
MLGGALSILSGAAGIVTAILAVAGAILTIFTSIFQGLAQGLTCAIAGSSWVQFGLGQMSGQGDLATGGNSFFALKPLVGPGSITLGLFNAVLFPAAMLAGVSGVTRMVYDITLHRGQGSPFIPIMTSLVPRIGGAALLLAPNPTGMPLAYATMLLLVNGFDVLANALFTFFGNAVTAGATTGSGASCGVGGNLAHYLIATAGSWPLANLIGIIAAVLFFFYDVFLMMMRLIFLVFCFAVAPLMIALCVWSPKNRFVQTWSELFIGALIIPCVMGTIFSVTLAAANAIESGTTSDGTLPSLLGEIVFCAGLWFAGKMVAKLVWHGVGSAHHSATGAVMATYAAVRGGEIGGRMLNAAQARSRHQETLESMRGPGIASGGSLPKSSKPVGGGLNQAAASGVATVSHDPGIPENMGPGEGAAFQAWATHSEQGQAVLRAYAPTEAPDAQTFARMAADPQTAPIVNHLAHDFMASPAVVGGWVKTPQEGASVHMAGGVGRYVDALSRPALGGAPSAPSPLGWPGAGVPAPAPVAAPAPAPLAASAPAPQHAGGPSFHPDGDGDWSPPEQPQ